MSHTPFPPPYDPHPGQYASAQHPVGQYAVGHHSPARPRLGARSVVGSVLWMLVLWGLVLVIAHGGLNTVTGQALDETALAQAKADRNVYFPALALTLAQSLPELVAAGAGILALVWAVRHRRWVLGPCAVGAVLAANLTTQLLKHGILQKPNLGVQEIAGNSFPSGHTTAAGSLLLAALLVAPAARRAQVGRWGALLAALVGMTTVLNGWHRPSDAAAALLVVGGWGVAAALLARCLDAVLARLGAGPGSTPDGALDSLREERRRRRQERAWSEDRGESAYVPPAHERAARERELAASSAARQAERQRFRAGQAGKPWQHGAPWWPVRPHLGTAVALILVTAALLALVVWWPYPAVAGTLAGRITLTAGYLGIASAAALAWSVVGRRLRPARR